MVLLRRVADLKDQDLLKSSTLRVPTLNFWSQQRLLRKRGLLSLGLATMLLLVGVSSVAAQTPQAAPTPALGGFAIPPLERYLNATRGETSFSESVKLDGYALFQIAAPASGSEGAGDRAFLENRVRTIENTLHRIVESTPDTQEMVVSTSTDANTGLPVITINGQYLMTVTTLDAQLQGSDLENAAELLVGTLETALLRARQERQPQFLVQQSMIALALAVGMAGLSGAIAHLQKRLQRHYQQLKAETPNEPTALDLPQDADSTQAPVTGLIVRQRLTKLQERNFSEIQRRLLNLLQVFIWAGGLFLILGLLPQTRWFQPLILSAPLKLIGIVLGTYVLMRISDILIDRFLEAIQDNQLLVPSTPQRLALRISTLSRVLKSGVAILWVGSAILVGLSVLGVNLLPLLAGAGIIGLAVSFAAQSVIKDMINGLLILLEDQYAVGDVITVGSVSGLVENMNLRITQLRDSEGRLITIPNNVISTVQNLSKDWSRVDLTVAVAYGTSPNEALQVMRQVADEMYFDPEWQAKLLEPPEILGIEDITHAGIVIRIWIKTHPLQQWIVAREFRRRLVLAMEQADLPIGIPQQLQVIDAIDGEVLKPPYLSRQISEQPRP